MLISDLNARAAWSASTNGNIELRNAFFALFNILKPNVFCDIGAHDGTASLTVRKIAPECKIYAFEANPEIHSVNAAALREQGIDYRNVAVSDSTGTGTVLAPRVLSRHYVDGEIIPGTVVEPTTTGKTSLLARNEEATYETFTVSTASLDSLLESEDRTASYFLWIDVEGASNRVLAGADKVLTRTLAIFIETETFDFWQGQKPADQIISQLCARGFIPFARDCEYDDKQFNVLLINASVAAKVYRALFDLRSDISKCFSPGRRIVSTVIDKTVATPRAKGTFASVVSCLYADVPVLVPTFNNPTYLRNMVKQLRTLRLDNLIVVDNASTYPPMLDLLSQLSRELRVVRNSANYGPRYLFRDEIQSLLPPLFCISDPDLQFNSELPDDFLAQLVSLTEQYKIGKAGFSLDISDRASLRDDSFVIRGKEYKIWEREEEYWQTPLSQLASGDQVYRALIDTTFAVYNKRYLKKENMLDAVRVAGRYTARHLPWERDSIVPEAENSYYCRTASEVAHYHAQSAEYATRVLLDTYKMRPDLQSTFPEVGNGDCSRLIDWAVGVCEQRWPDGDYLSLRPYTKWFVAQKATERRV